MAKKPSDTTIAIDSPADAPADLEAAPPAAAPPPAPPAPAPSPEAAPPSVPAADPYPGEVEELERAARSFLEETGRFGFREEPEEDVCALVLAEVKKQTGLTHVGAEVRNLYPAPRGFSVEFAFSKEQQPSMMIALRLSGEEAERIAHLWRRYLYACERGE